MAEGLQIFNSAGQLAMDSNDRTIKIIGSHSSNQAGSLSVPEIGDSNGQYVVIIDYWPSNLDSQSLDGGTLKFPYVFSYSYPNLSWTIQGMSGSTFYAGSFRYGYY